MREYQRRLRAADPRTCLCGKAIEVGSKRRFCTPCGNERRKKSHQESKKKRLEEGRALGKHCACGTWLPAGPRKLGRQMNYENSNLIDLEIDSWQAEAHRRLAFRPAGIFWDYGVDMMSPKPAWKLSMVEIREEELEGLDRAGFRDLVRQKLQVVGDDLLKAWEERNG
jgi:hypothetical protein